MSQKLDEIDKGFGRMWSQLTRVGLNGVTYPRQQQYSPV